MRIAAWVLTLFGGCTSGSLPEGVLFAGCAMVTPDGVCWADHGQLTVWAPEGRLTVDGVAVGGMPVLGGQRFDLDVRDGAVVLDGRPLLQVVSQLEGLGDCTSPGGPVGEAWCARLEGRQRMAEGGPDAAAERFDRAAGLMQAAGWRREAEVNRERARYQRAQAHGGRWEDGPSRPMDADAYRWLIGALVREVGLQQAGQLRSLRHLQQVIVELEAKVGAAAALDEARLRQARTELALGNTGEGLRTLHEVLAVQAGSGCTALDHVAAVGWMAGWLSWNGSNQGMELARKVLVHLESASIDACEGRGRVADRHVDLALLRLVTGDVAGARAALDDSSGLDKRAETAMWWHLLRGEIELGEGTALAHADAARLAAAEAGLVEGAWMSRDLRAAALAASGDAGGALQAWQEAGQELQRVAALTPLLGGRAAFLDQRAVAAGRHVGLLLREGRAAEAMEVGRTWRRSIAVGTWAAERVDSLTDTGLAPVWTEHTERLEAHRAARASLERRLRVVPASQRQEVERQLDAARHSEDELIDEAARLVGEVSPAAGRSRAPGEGVLLVVPAGGRAAPAWRALWQDDEGVVPGAVLADADVRRDPGLLLAAAGDRLLRVDGVSLLLPAALEALDLHLVPIAGVPWALEIPVRWSLDLDRPAPGPAGRTALIVGDPEGALAGARDEAAHAAEVLRRDGWAVTALGRGTDHSILASALRSERPAWLHVAAHGAPDRSDPRLVLAGGTAWTVRDALAMARPPQLVLLSSCQAARSDSVSTAGLGLAHAFVRGGAEAAFAPVADVQDEASARLAAVLMAARPWHDSPENAFRSALRAAAAAGDLRLVSSYRLITR